MSNLLKRLSKTDPAAANAIIRLTNRCKELEQINLNVAKQRDAALQKLSLLSAKKEARDE